MRFRISVHFQVDCSTTELCIYSDGWAHTNQDRAYTHHFMSTFSILLNIITSEQATNTYTSEHTCTPTVPVLKAGHLGVLVIVCLVFVLFWCGVLDLGFFMTNLASVLYTCIFMYVKTRLTSVYTYMYNQDRASVHTNLCPLSVYCST